MLLLIFVGGGEKDENRTLKCDIYYGLLAVSQSNWCVCVCVRERERERRDSHLNQWICGSLRTAVFPHTATI